MHKGHGGFSYKLYCAKLMHVVKIHLRKFLYILSAVNFWSEVILRSNTVAEKETSVGKSILEICSQQSFALPTVYLFIIHYEHF